MNSKKITIKILHLTEKDLVPSFKNNWCCVIETPSYHYFKSKVRDSITISDIVHFTSEDGRHVIIKNRWK